MAVANSKKNTKAPKTSKVAATKKTVSKKVAAPSDDAEESGSKRKRVTFSQKLTESEPKTKKVAVSKKKVAVTVTEDAVEEKEEEETIVEDVEEDLTEEQEEALRREILGDIASSEGEDSSDDEAADIDNNANVVALDAGELKKSMEETKKTFEKKVTKPSKAPKVEEKGVIFLGRIPHGFYEKEMKGYFSQFGDITRLRLSRNKKTGNSKHYAFIEFESEDVAQIVTETMDNYLLFGKLLQCKLIPSSKVHENLFVGADKVFKPVNTALMNRQCINKPKTAEALAAKCAKLISNEASMRKKLVDAGIDYDFPGYNKSA
ncbi:uncharacterized protein EV154DRAFT_459820 [Mucor mucedo]|uniref:uncharacterized protein n=1 Tax=Mucor mucedo TaxID=29922 RepID=UPI00222016A6|nr:uncharacterized protein EV154DRAFT_459820 [Mucor mucedo]KAI7894117.1 hypothetical protein EV154DRAFT_459820 [Mucor mucedo]